VKAASQAEQREFTETDAVRLAQQGDAGAFERIYRLHSRKIYALCLRMVGNQTEAEDLTQDVFLHLFRKIGAFRGESAFSTWLHRMSVNIVLARFRKKAPPETSFDTIADPEGQSNTAPAEFGVPDLQLNGVVDRVTLQAAIDQLAPGYKAMFILRYVEGYQHNEIAQMCGCSVGNTKSQVHKARTRLCKLLQDTMGDHTRHHRKSIASSLDSNGSKFTVDCVNA
jgi:RNA polymerase sigma-70 factor, ECF subfamily